MSRGYEFIIISSPLCRHRIRIARIYAVYTSVQGSVVRWRMAQVRVLLIPWRGHDAAVML